MSVRTLGSRGRGTHVSASGLPYCQFGADECERVGASRICISECQMAEAMAARMDSRSRRSSAAAATPSR